MARKSQAHRVDRLIAVTMFLADTLRATLELHCEGSEPVQEQLRNVSEILYSIADPHYEESATNEV